MSTRSVLSRALVLSAISVLASAALAEAAIPPKLLASAPISSEPLTATVGAGYLFWSDQHYDFNRMTADLAQAEVLPLPANVCDFRGLAMDRSGFLYGTDNWISGQCDSKLLHRLTTAGTLVFSFCDYAGTSGFAFGGEFAISQRGDFFAAGGIPSVRRFSPNGTLTGYWGTFWFGSRADQRPHHGHCDGYV